MQNDKKESVNIHPLMTAREKSRENKVEFQGFISLSDKNFIRLYTDLQGLSYVEIPEEAILYFEKATGGKAGKISIFVSASKQVTEVQRRFVTAHSSTLSAYSPATTIDKSSRNTKVPQPASYSLCIKKLWYAFAANAAQIISLNAQIANETNPQRREFLIMRLETRKLRAKNALRFCLSDYRKTG